MTFDDFWWYEPCDSFQQNNSLLDNLFVSSSNVSMCPQSVEGGMPNVNNPFEESSTILQEILQFCRDSLVTFRNGENFQQNNSLLDNLFVISSNVSMWTLPEGILMAKNSYYQTAKTITFSNISFCSLKFCHNKKIPLEVVLQLLNPVATIFSPGLRIHGTYMVGMINGPLGFALYYIHYWLSTYTYVVESCRPPLGISSVGGQNR